MRTVSVCDLTKAIMQSSRPKDPAQAIREEPDIKSLQQAEWTERHKGEHERERQREREKRGRGQLGHVEGKV